MVNLYAHDPKPRELTIWATESNRLQLTISTYRDNRNFEGRIRVELRDLTNLNNPVWKYVDFPMPSAEQEDFVGLLNTFLKAVHERV